MDERRSDEWAQRGTRQRLPRGLLGMFALMLAIEAGLERAEVAVGPLSAIDWGLDRDAAGRANQSEILCFGDSLIKCGLAPAVLEARLDRTAFNLAALGATPPATYFLLKRTLDSGARPRAIILDAKASTLNAANYRLTVRDWASLIGPLDAPRLASDDGDLGFFGLHLAHHVLPSVRMRLDIRRAVCEELSPTAVQADIPWGEVVTRQHIINRGGFYRSPSHPKDGPDMFPGGVLPIHEEVVCYPSSWAPYPTNLIYLDRTISLACKRGIPVFLLIPPIHPGVQAGREARGLDAAYVGLIRKIHDKYQGVTVLDGRHAQFGHGVFADSHHLSCEGAAALSLCVAEAIAALLEDTPGEDRWIPLPAYADPAAIPPIEDMDESRLALERKRSQR